MRQFLRVLLSIISVVLLSTHLSYGQPSLYKLRDKVNPKMKSLKNPLPVKITNPTQATVSFIGQNLTTGNLKNWLQTNLDLRPGIDSFVETGVPTKAASNLIVGKLQQYYRGIKVAHGIINHDSRNEQLTMMQLEFYSIPLDFNILPMISITDGLKNANAYLQINSSELLSPAELCIVRNYEDDSTVCLAWKYEIVATNEIKKEQVFVNAISGKVVLSNDLICTAFKGEHNQATETSDEPIFKNDRGTANVTGSAQTRYSGTQTIITDDSSGVQGKPYRLHQSRDGHNIITLNYNQNKFSLKNDSLATEFIDNDNQWTAFEYYNANNDDVALDVHFNMQLINDYWRIVHQRNSWDNNNSAIRSYIHVSDSCNGHAVPLDNAFWSGSDMYFGDGSVGFTGATCGSTHFRPLTSLDVSAHEMGHAITQSTSNLVYRWESGAINEGMSDIWGATIEDWAVGINPSIAPGKSTWKMGEEISSTIGVGLRDMQNPRSLGQPSTYHDDKWRPATFKLCPILNTNNDECGVHYNSGVLAKWYYLITMGETGTNSLNKPYNVAGIGFAKSRNLAYLLSLNLTPNSVYSTAKDISLEAAKGLWGNTSAEYNSVVSAWRAVGVDSAIYDTTNTPIFKSNLNQAFTAIGEDGYGNIWAGTDKKGLYVFDGTTWTKRPEITNVKINGITRDRGAGMWVAQSGTVNTGTATAGGVNYFDIVTDPMTAFYTVSTQTNVPTRNVRSIFCDYKHFTAGSNPRIWIATDTYINSSGNAVQGKPAVGLNAGSPYFTAINGGMQAGNTTGGVTAIGGNDSIVWTFAPTNNGANQILAYDAVLGSFLTAYDNSTNPVIPANFKVTSIYTDVSRRTWFGLTTNAILVSDQYAKWHYISIPSVFPAGSSVNSNTIVGNGYDEIYFGTPNGVLFFDPQTTNGDTSKFNNPNNFRMFTKANGLPSNNVTGIVYDYPNFKVWIATDQGICAWDPLCLGDACTSNWGANLTVSSKTDGNWSDTAVWENNQIPDSNTNVIIGNNITVDIPAKCYTLSILPGAKTSVNPTQTLTIFRKDDVGVETGR